MLHLKKVKVDINMQTENNAESFQGKTSVEPNTNPTDNRKQNLPQIPDSSYSETFFRKRLDASVDFPQQFPEGFSSEQTQAEDECLRLRHQQRIEAANQLLRKQGVERI